MRNARFWVWWNGDWVKLTLRPGGSIRLHECYETDEGYSFTNELFEHDGDRVIHRCVSGGRDCDGPIKHHSEYECELQYLTSGTDPLSPPWTRTSARVYDAYAEAMNY